MCLHVATKTLAATPTPTLTPTPTPTPTAGEVHADVLLDPAAISTPTRTLDPHP